MQFHTSRNPQDFLLTAKYLRTLFSHQQDIAAQPGLYAKIMPCNTRIDYRYYAPNDHMSTTLDTSYKIQVFNHHAKQNQTRLIDMAGVIASASIQEINSLPELSLEQEDDALLAYNFSVLSHTKKNTLYEAIASELHISPPAFTSFVSYPIHALYKNLLDWGIPNYLTPQSTHFYPHHMLCPSERWQNYTWLAVFQDTHPVTDNVSTNYALAIRTLSSMQAEPLDPLHTVIPIVTELNDVAGYRNLFYLTKTLGNISYRGLDGFSSAYVYWMLHDYPFPFSDQDSNTLDNTEDDQHEDMVRYARNLSMYAPSNNHFNHESTSHLHCRI